VLAAARAADRPRRHEGTSETEAAIFEATERLLTQTPLTELSVAQIIGAAGISRATFYFYFSSKFAVLAGLLARINDEIFEVVQPFVQRQESVPPEQALSESLTAAVSLWRRHRPALQAIHEHWNATDQLRELWISATSRFIAATAAEIERQREGGLASFAGDSARISSALIWSTAQCLYVSGTGVDRHLPNEQAALAALGTLWHSTLYRA
jgi:AcrR family transcriptional regulator